jgi:predicted Fe-S protein YdhL (DUF1289 family)
MFAPVTAPVPDEGAALQSVRTWSRRQVVRNLFTPLLPLAGATRAAETLLDPATLERPRPSAPPAGPAAAPTPTPLSGAREGLLDPAALGRPAAGGGAPSAAPSPAAASPSSGRLRLSPAQGRLRAQAVIAALDALTKYLGELLKRLEDEQARQRKLENEVSELKQERYEKLQEYRDGLFCSGCGKTKSEILKLGEQFPHKGQTIIRATPQQIESKERELNRPIEDLRREIAQTEADIARLQRTRDEMLDQFEQGVKHWHAGISYEQAALWTLEVDAEAAFQAEKSGLERSVVDLRAALKGKPEREPEMQGLQRQLQQLVQRRRTEHAAYETQITQANNVARSESSHLNDLIDMRKVRQVINTRVDPVMIGRGAGFNGLGGLFRMGDASPERHGDIVPTVRSFVVDFLAAKTVDCDRSVSGAFCGTQQVLPAQTTPYEQLKQELRERLRCDPQKEYCPPKPSGSSGVRG